MGDATMCSECRRRSSCDALSSHDPASTSMAHLVLLATAAVARVVAPNLLHATARRGSSARCCDRATRRGTVCAAWLGALALVLAISAAAACAVLLRPALLRLCSIRAVPSAAVVRATAAVRGRGWLESAGDGAIWRRRLS